MFFYKENEVKAASYSRLSREDGDKMESDSIRNQKDLIADYAAQRGIRIVSEYTDDGYSGTNFDRPNFQRMMEDVKKKKINCIIVKDLSRLGRNYIETGRYLEKIFPFLGVRFIAINDHYDSADESGDADQIVIPFKNLINDAYGNVMCSRGSVIPLFIDQIKRKAPITITDTNMTRFLMNLDEAVDLVAFAFEHAEPGDLFIQKADASTIGDLADGVMRVFGETEKKIIGSRHGEKLYETLMTREERLRSVDMGHYFRITPDTRGLNYDKFYVEGTVSTEGDEAYTSHNTNRLDVDGVVKKIMGTDYVKEELEGRPHTVEA